jgi:hypothetical protein
MFDFHQEVATTCWPEAVCQHSPDKGRTGMTGRMRHAPWLPAFFANQLTLVKQKSVIASRLC